MIFGLPPLATLHFPVGVIIGIAAAAPVGPVNLLVLQRAIGARRGAALLVGLGAALGDALFAAAAAFGLGALVLAMEEYVGAVRITGGLIMLAFALLLWRAAPHLVADARQPPALRTAAVAFTMTVTNPATLVFFVGSFGAVAFTAMGHDTPRHLLNAGLVVAGVFAGSMLWWLVVVLLAGYLRGRMDDRLLSVLNHFTAIVLVLFGLAAIIAGALAS